MKRPATCLITTCLLCYVLSGMPLYATAAFEAPYQFALAKLYLEDGDYREAMGALALVVKLDPEEPYARIEYAELLARLGRYEKAAEQADRAFELAPGSTDVLRVYAQVHWALAQAGKVEPEDAQIAFEELLAAEPSDLAAVLSLGQIYLAAQEPGKALDLFSRTVRVQRPTPAFFSRLIGYLLDAGRPQEAEELLGDILLAAPDHLEGRLSRAELQEKRGDLEGALETLRAAPATDLAEPEVRRRMALLLYRTGEAESALETLDGVVREFPEQSVSRYWRALILADMRRDETAEGELRELLQRDPDQFDLVAALTGVLQRSGRSAEAIELWRSFVERATTRGHAGLSRQAKLELGALHASNGDWPEVLTLTSQLAEAEQGYTEDLTLLHVQALTAKARSAEAITFLRQALLEHERSRPLRLRLATLLVSEGLDDDAGLELNRLTATGEYEDLMLAAQVWQSFDYFERSVPLLERATQARGNSVQGLFWLGAAYERTQEEDRAADAFHRVLKLRPDFAPALNYLGYMWADRGVHLDEALAMVVRAVELDPDNGAYVDSLGWAHFRMGRIDEARAHLERAADLIPADGTILEHLGDVYNALLEDEKARDAYRRALDLEVENGDEIRRKLSKLGG